MVTIENLSKFYYSGNQKQEVLKNISLSINTGEIFGIIGKSGAGKSTLLRTINGLEKPDQGSIQINGINLNDLNKIELREKRKNIGMIFQHFNLLKTQSVLYNITLPLILNNYKLDEYNEWIDQLISITNLTGKINAYPSQLSGGEKQRVSIARALVAKPSVLLSDEATSSLDSETTHEILQLLVKINQAYNITIILITHEIGVIRQICDRVAILHEGEMAEIATVKDFFNSPQSSIGKRLLTDYQIKKKEMSEDKE